MARTRDASLFLTDNSAVFSIQGAGQAGGTASLENNHESRIASVVRISVVDSKLTPRITPLVPLPGRVNYLIGKGPSGWHRDVPIFSHVLYQGIYDGIDLAYYGGPKGLEYDFLVAPGADPKKIRLEIDGSSPARLDSQGNLIVDTPSGAITMARPVAFQATSAGTNPPVQSSFRLDPNTHTGKGQEVSIEVAAYDHSRALVIDPQIITRPSTAVTRRVSVRYWRRRWHFCPTSFRPTRRRVQPMSPSIPAGWPTLPVSHIPRPAPGAEGRDRFNAAPLQNPVAFVAKFNPRLIGAASLIYATYLGSRDSDSSIKASATEIRPSGLRSTAVAMPTLSVAHIPAVHPLRAVAGSRSCGPWGSSNNVSSASTGIGFISELNPSGNSLVYSCYIDGAKGTTASRVALQPGCTSNCQAFVVGSTQSKAVDGFQSPALRLFNRTSTSTGSEATLSFW